MGFEPVKEAEQNTETSVAKHAPRVIAVSSGKGGVGKSTITVNLGISLAKTGAKVCLFDADTGLANVNILMGLTPQYSLEHVLFGAKSIEDVMLDGPHGMKIVPGANGISECVSLHPRQQLRLTRELARVEEDFDFILVDTAAGISETTLDFISASQHTLVVITPEPTSLTDAFSLIKLLKRRHSRIEYHVVVNMCSNATQAKEVFHRFSAAVEKYIGTQPQYMGYVLRDESLRAAVTLQNPVALFPETDPSCRSFVRLADILDRVTATAENTTQFSVYWQKQYRQQSRQSSDKHESSTKPETELLAESRDNDYLSELRSRLLMLIEQGHADEEQLSDMMKESISAYVKRYKTLPLDIIESIDHIVTSPERQDQLLRDIFDRVRPWGVGFDVPPTSEIVHGPVGEEPEPQDIDTDNKPSGSNGAEPDSAQPQPAQASSAPEPVDVPKLEVTVESPVGEAAAAMAHSFNARRFGSQQQLLSQLRQQSNSDISVANWLANLS